MDTFKLNIPFLCSGNVTFVEENSVALLLTDITIYIGDFFRMNVYS